MALYKILEQIIILCLSSAGQHFHKGKVLSERCLNNTDKRNTMPWAVHFTPRSDSGVLPKFIMTPRL